MKTEEILDVVTGYINGFERVIAATGMDVEALEDLLLDNNIEKCDHCDLYTESYNLLNDDGEVDGYCDNCRSEGCQAE